MGDIGSGCVSAFSTLEGVAITGSMATSHTTDLTTDASCYGGMPGLGSVFEIAIYSTGPGTGVLEIESLELL